jgi:hypothetical protein
MEARLAEERDSKRVLEARLHDVEASEGASKAAVKDLQNDLKETEEKLVTETNARKELEAEISRLSKETDLLRRAGLDAASVMDLQGQFASLKIKIAEKLKSGEIAPEDVIKFMKATILGFYIVRGAPSGRSRRRQKSTPTRTCGRSFTGTTSRG